MEWIIIDDGTDKIEELVDCKISAVSTGPRREETILLDQIN